MKNKDNYQVNNCDKGKNKYLNKLTIEIYSTKIFKLPVVPFNTLRLIHFQLLFS